MLQFTDVTIDERGIVRYEVTAIETADIAVANSAICARRDGVTRMF